MKYIKKIKPFHTDKRGSISRLLDSEINITNILIISCKKGSIRANHYHKKDTHYSYMLKGEMEYFYKNPKLKNGKVNKLTVKEGEIVCSPPMIAHAMKFTKASTFLVFTTEPRGKKAYEKDKVRIPLIK